MTLTTEKQQSGTLHALVHDSSDAVNPSSPASSANPAPGRTAADRNNTNITEAPCTDNGKTIEKKINKGPSPRAGKRFGWRSKKEDAAKSGPDRMHPLLRDGISIFIFSQKRLPSGFGSVRYLGKGRKNAYAVHPPVKMTPGEKAIRPPALCYVPDRNSGFKVLSLYHAGLFQGGLERNPASLQARFSEMLAAIGMTAEEYPTGDLLLKARGTLPGSGGSSPEGGQSLQKTGGSSPEAGQSLPKTGDSLPKTSGSALTFLEIILQARSAAKGALILPQESSIPNPVMGSVMDPEKPPVMGSEINPVISPEINPVISPEINPVIGPEKSPAIGPEIPRVKGSETNPTGNPVMNPELDRSFSDQHSAGYLEADHDKDKTYVDLLLNMSLYFRQILKKMKQDESGDDPVKENAVHEILQRQMLQGIELLKGVSPESSFGEYFSTEGSFGKYFSPEGSSGKGFSTEGSLGKGFSTAGSLGKGFSTEGSLGKAASPGSSFGKISSPEGPPAEGPGDDYFEMTDPQDIMPDKGTVLTKQAGEYSLWNSFSGSDLLQEKGLPATRDFKSPEEKGLATIRDFESPQEKGLPTIREVYRDFYDFKYGPNAARRLSHSSRCATAAACRKLAPLFDRTLDEVSVIELQNLVNRTAVGGYSRSSVTDLVTLIRQLYRFAYPRELCTKEYGKYVVMPFTAEEIHHQDFTDDELQILWKHQNDPVVNMVLIMCYSGFRISEFTRENDMKTVFSKDGTTGYFMGGMKTKAGKNRIVPIHSAIFPLVKKTLNSHGQPVYLCGKSRNRFRDDMKAMLEEIGIDTVPGSDPLEGTQTDALSNFRYHTPHSCRHTFSRLCESYGVNEADRRRMMGHSFGNDVTNGVYGHRSVKELSLEIEKIQIPVF